jgi:drug/metabolite transporter (DMT)-like permease
MTDPGPVVAPSHKSARAALVAVLAGGVAIGFAPIFVRLSELGPSATAFHRLFLALPAMWLWLLLERRTEAQPRARRGEVLKLVGTGLFFAADLALWHWSILFTSVANATLFANFAPIFVTLGAWLLYRQRPAGRFVAALVLAMGGAVVLMGGSLSLDLVHLSGDALGVACSIFYAGYILAVSRLRGRFSTAAIMAWSGLGTAAALLPVALASGEPLVAPSAYGWGILLGLALLSHVGGQGLIAFGLAHLPPAFGAMVLLIQPAVAALLAWLLLDEPLTAWQAAGAVAILAGIRLARR